MTSPTQLTIGCYNVYFDELYFMERFQYIIERLLTDCQIVCLQEIPTRHLEKCEKVLLANQFLYITYASSGTYGLITASKLAPLAIKEVRFDETIMDRCFLDFIIQINDKTIHLINTHLESLFQFQVTRESQMKQIIQYCSSTSTARPSEPSKPSAEINSIDSVTEAFLETSVLLGDFNSVYKKLYFDRFLTPQVDQITWFGKRFNMSASSCRFDRIYTGAQIAVSDSVKTIGNQIIPTIGYYPSDHNGMIVKIGLVPSPRTPRIN